MKGKAIVPLILGLGIGLVAVKVGLDKIQSSYAASVEKNTVTAVRALRDIDAHTLITAEMVEEIETQVNAFLPTSDLMSSAESVVGRVSGKAVPSGTPVLQSMLAPEGTLPGIDSLIKPGFRAASVKIDEVTGVAYQLKPGDWVDVIVVMDVSARGRKKETVAEVILQHIEVAAVGRTVPGGSDRKGRGKTAKSITLLLPEADIPKLPLAAARGKITLALRGEDDSVTEEGTYVRESEMFASMKEKEPPPAPAPPAAPTPTEPKTPAWADFLATLMTPNPQTMQMAVPHELVVYRGSGGQGATVKVQRFVFASANSRQVLQVSTETRRGAAGMGASNFLQNPSWPRAGNTALEGSAFSRPDADTDDDDRPGKETE